MKAEWMTAVLIASFSGALAVATGASGGGMGSDMKSHENSGGTTEYGNSSKVDFKKLDEDGDGRISRAEAAARPQLGEYFQRLDRNRDRQLDKGEFSQFETMMEEKRSGAKDGDQKESW